MRQTVRERRENDFRKATRKGSATEILVEYGYLMDGEVYHDHMNVYAVTAKEARWRARKILRDWGIRSLYELTDPDVA